MQFGLRQGSGCLIPSVTSGIAEFVGNGRCGLGGVLPNACVTSLCRSISLATASLSKLFFRRPFIKYYRQRLNANFKPAPISSGLLSND
ncbi:TPA: hypothetical protein ACLA4L_001925, partial [Neisseria meningitidis]